jgi:pimeloyl-ACP methyl ester carboxylesterase
MHIVAHALLWTLMILVIGGCGISPSQFIPGPLPGIPPRALAYPQPEKRILLIYNHGSKVEYRFDKCDPNGRTTPRVVKALSGQIVGAFDTFHDTGVPADHIFLVGQSAGGWASLLVARRQQVPINAVIAFAPAFAGQKAKRPDDMQTVQELHIAFLSAAERLNALVFAFDDDPYNTPEDLAVLRAIPGIRFIRLPADVIAGRRCERAKAHATAFRDCFAQTQMDVILTYIAERVTIGNQ